MADILFSNFGQSALASPVGTGDTTAILAAGTGSLFPSPTGSQYFVMVITDAATSTNHEVWYVTARSGDSITMTRAEEGTTAQAWIAGDVVICAPTEGTMNAIGQILDIQHGAFNYAIDTGSANAYAVALTPSATTGTQGMIVKFKAINANTGASTLTVNGGTTYSLFAINGADLNPNAIVANGIVTAEFDSNLGGYVLLSCTGSNYVLLNQIPVRQTVLSGPVDANGFPNFGGITGSTTVTATGTLIVTAANGASYNSVPDRVGAITNPSWTGLSTTGKMYLYLDIAADGSCTTGSTTHAPVYQWGGSYSTTAGQFTFNIQAMSGKVGNGATSTQTFRVFVGQVTVTGSLVSAIVWYALMGRYRSVITSIVPATEYDFSHNIGVYPHRTSTLVRKSSSFAWYEISSAISYSSPSANYQGIETGQIDNNTAYVATADGIWGNFTTPAHTGSGTAGEIILMAERGW